MICPNADGSESPTYTEHNDRVNLESRLRVLASRAERERMLATLADSDAGCVTLYMSKVELRARLRQAFWAANWWRWPWVNVSESEAREIARMSRRATP